MWNSWATSARSRHQPGRPPEARPGRRCPPVAGSGAASHARTSTTPAGHPPRVRPGRPLCRHDAGSGTAGHDGVSMTPGGASTSSATKSTALAGPRLDLVELATPTSARYRPAHRPRARSDRRRRPACWWTWCSRPRRHHHSTDPGTGRERGLVDGAGRPVVGPGATGHAGRSTTPARHGLHPNRVGGASPPST